MISWQLKDAEISAKGSVSDREQLCSILLEVAGRDTNRLPSIRRHVAALDQALPFMTKAQADIARARIRHHEDRWGSLLAGGENMQENGGTRPETLVHDWLSVRRDPERYLRVLRYAAESCHGGETSISRIRDASYRHEFDGVTAYVAIDSFREWLLKLRIAQRETPGTYRPGQHCEWWINEMHPDTGTAYAACLKRYGTRMRRSGLLSKRQRRAAS